MSSLKQAALESILTEYESCLVAFSGGVDSTLLAVVAHRVLGERMLAVIADSPSLPRAELEEAKELAIEFGFPLEVIATDEFKNQEYVSNPINRCFYCKQALFSKLAPMAESRGFNVIAYGENNTDLGDHRPGAKAARNFEVKAPLKEAGLEKADIRAISERMRLPTAGKPEMACLSSRIPYGETVTPEKLLMIEKAEGLFRDAGFEVVRVRHHQLEKGGALARVELGAEDLKRFVLAGGHQALCQSVLGIGYQHLTLDAFGYRRGSLNEGLAGFVTQNKMEKQLS